MSECKEMLKRLNASPFIFWEGKKSLFCHLEKKDRKILLLSFTPPFEKLVFGQKRVEHTLKMSRSSKDKQKGLILRMRK